MMETEKKTREQQLKIALRYTISKSPGFAGIALWVPLRIVEQDGIAWTNGRTITFASGFFQLSPLEQGAVVAHEVLHVALRHIQRVRGKDVNPLLWNICCDAVINECIGKMPWLTLPEGAIRLERLLTAQELEQTPPYQWTSERLYDHLCRTRQFSDQDFMADLQDDGKEDESPLAEKIWRERMVRAQAGDRPGGLLRAVSHDLPPETLPWGKLLRRWMAEPLLPQRQVDWSRPSRRTLALESDYFEPSTRRAPGLVLAGVAVDTSGSIDDELLARFAAEVQGIQNRTGCSILLVTADCEVTGEYLVRSDGKSLSSRLRSQEVQFRGGGGTSFVPALRRMEERGVRVMVYLTDLCGDFGDRTRYPFQTIWASTRQGVEAPFGRTIYL